MIIECYILPYNPVLIKAFHGQTIILPVYSSNEWFTFEEQLMVNVPKFENTELSELLISHNVVPLTEMFSLADENKIRDIASTKVEYISTYCTHKTTFRKVQTPTEDTYFVKGKGYFEQLSSNIIRHFGRINGKELLLIETCLYFDVMTKKESEGIFDVYREKIDKIPKGDIVGVYNSKLPTYILCENKQVLKLRSGLRKVMKTPYFLPESQEYKHSKVLLFYPIQPRTEIDMEKIDELYYARGPVEKRDKNGKILTICEENELKCFDKLIWNRRN